MKPEDFDSVINQFDWYLQYDAARVEKNDQAARSPHHQFDECGRLDGKYRASDECGKKAGVIGFTKSAAREGAARGSPAMRSPQDLSKQR